MNPGPLRRAAYFLPSAVTILILLVALQLLLPVLKVPTFIFPLPSQVLSLLLSSNIPWATHTWVTLSEAIYGYGLAVVFGISLAIVIHLSKALRIILEPIVLAAQVMPKIAFVPILFLWLGLNFLPRMLTVFLVCFFPIVIDTTAGLGMADRDMLDLVRSFNSSRLVLLRKVSFPSALPSIFAGLKISITLALLGAIVAEFVSSSQGLGYLIFSAQTQLDTTLAFASATILVLLGFLLYGVLLIIERLAVPWRSAEG